MDALREADGTNQAATDDPALFDLGDPAIDAIAPAPLDPVTIDPDLFLPKFELWVHGVTGTRVFSPTPESAFTIVRRAGGIHVRPSGSGTDTRVVLWFPFQWPAVVPGDEPLETRRPKPKRAMVLYRTNNSKIVGVSLVEAVGPYGDAGLANASVNWSGSHAGGLDSQNVVSLSVTHQPKFGLVLALVIEFDSAGTGPWCHVASVGLEFRIPS